VELDELEVETPSYGLVVVVVAAVVVVVQSSQELEPAATVAARPATTAVTRILIGLVVRVDWKSKEVSLAEQVVGSTKRMW